MKNYFENCVISFDGEKLNLPVCYIEILELQLPTIGCQSVARSTALGTRSKNFCILMTIYICYNVLSLQKLELRGLVWSKYEMSSEKVI